jgi:hypothetical protein
MNRVEIDLDSSGGCVMGPQFVFSALVVAFVVAITCAAVTTVRHVKRIAHL